VRVAVADAREQQRAFLARGGIRPEVHVLHHQVDRLAPEDLQAILRRRRGAVLDVVQRAQRCQCGGDGGVVVDDEDGGHGRSLRTYTLLVATAGGTAAARRAGPRTESWPSSHSTSAPTGRYSAGSRGIEARSIMSWLSPNASIMPSTMPSVASRKFSVWK